MAVTAVLITNQLVTLLFLPAFCLKALLPELIQPHFPGHCAPSPRREMPTCVFVQTTRKARCACSYVTHHHAHGVDAMA